MQFCKRLFFVWFAAGKYSPVKAQSTSIAANDSCVHDLVGEQADGVSSDAAVIKKSIRSLNKEHRRFHGAIALNRFHWIILLASLLVTIGAWYVSSNTIADEVASRFEHQHAQVTELLYERLVKYEDALLSGVAASKMWNRTLVQSEWKRYAEALDISTRHPGISGIGIIVTKKPDEIKAYERAMRRDIPDFNVYPSSSGEELFVITQIEPIENNREALGLNVAFESNRREGANRSRDSGDAIITGPIVLVQDEQKTPGFLFFAPVYKSNDLNTARERRNAFSHWVYAPFIMSELIGGVLEESSRKIGIRITDNGENLYSEWPVDSEQTPLEIGGSQTELNVFGRQWLVEAWPLKSFYSHTESNQPLLVLIGGLIIDAILFLMFWLMAKANRRVTSLAEDLAIASDHLNTKTLELQQSNTELQNFACVVSHDLKSPLVGLTYLADIVQEDLELASIKQPLATEVEQNLNRIQKLTHRMSQLIDGVLDYSAVGNGTAEVETVDVTELLAEIKEDLQLENEQIAYENNLPTLQTSQLPLKQVLENLISNAVKYHTAPEDAVVRIYVEDYPGHLQFSVVDTGPGIDPQYHDRIFEVFETIESTRKIDSTGVGLAIVKKIVEKNGGAIKVASALGEGSTFSFSWPKNLPETTAEPRLKLAS